MLENYEITPNNNWYRNW